MVLFIILLIVAIAVTALFIRRRAFRSDYISLLLKISASVCFVLVGAVSGAKETMPVILGLVFGLLGDIFLDMKYVYRRQADMHTLCGFVAFMIGHVFYFYYQLTRFGSYTLGLLLSIVIALVFAAVIYFVTPSLLQLDYGNFRLISAIYAAILVFGTAFAGFNAFGKPTSSGKMFLDAAAGPRIMFFVGLVLFLLSDLVLSQIYFGRDKNTPAATIANLSLYYAGQLVIAASLFFI